MNHFLINEGGSAAVCQSWRANGKGLFEQCEGGGVGGGVLG